MLDKNIRDLSNLPIYMYQSNKKGEFKMDKDRFYLFYSTRGINLIEFYYEILEIIHRIWRLGIEFSNCILIEKNHRYNYAIFKK